MPRSSNAYVRLDPKISRTTRTPLGHFNSLPSTCITRLPRERRPALVSRLDQGRFRHLSMVQDVDLTFSDVDSYTFHFRRLLFPFANRRGLQCCEGAHAVSGIVAKRLQRNESSSGAELPHKSSNNAGAHGPSIRLGWINLHTYQYVGRAVIIRIIMPCDFEGVYVRGTQPPENVQF